MMKTNPITGSVLINLGIVGGNMRKIAFRVWDKEEKVMLYPEDDVIDICFSKRGIDVINTSISEWLREGTFELLEHTGLKDKKGKMIFEGDIVRHRDNQLAKIRNDEIIFEDGGFIAKSHSSLQRRTFIGITMEVIGNIYENPELLNSGR